MDSYRQTLASAGVSLERNTSAVPADGFFYVIAGGELLGRYRTLKQARLRYQQAIEESGWKPPEKDERVKADPAVEAVERYMDALASYWDAAHNHRRPGAGRA